MDLRFAQSLLHALGDDRCAFGYGGSFPDEHSARLIDLGSAVLAEQGLGTVDRVRAGYVMVEAYQNVVRHGAAIAPALRGKGGPLFLFRSMEKRRQVVTFNAVSRAQAEELRRRLAALQASSPAQLKELFLAGLKGKSGPGARGAGLGMIEMMRRGGHAAAYAERPLDEDLALLRVAHGIGRAPDEEAGAADGFALHDLVLEARCLLFHVGLRPPGAQEALMRILEQEMAVMGVRGSSVMQAMLAAFSLLGVLVPMSPGQLVACCGDGGRYVLLLGGRMDRTWAERTGSWVRELAGWEGVRLQQAYREALLDPTASRIPLGLVDLARASPEPIAMTSYQEAGRVTVLLRVQV